MGFNSVFKGLITQIRFVFKGSSQS